MSKVAALCHLSFEIHAVLCKVVANIRDRSNVSMDIFVMVSVHSHRENHVVGSSLGNAGLDPYRRMHCAEPRSNAQRIADGKNAASSSHSCREILNITAPPFDF
ncbi:MAG: hypothetical protein ABL858_03680 [Candidatus Nitrotoga sp.]